MLYHPILLKESDRFIYTCIAPIHRLHLFTSIKKILVILGLLSPSVKSMPFRHIGLVLILGFNDAKWIRVIDGWDTS